MENSITGSYDLHIHTGPDVFPRKLGDNTEEALQKIGMRVVQDTLAVLSGDFSTAHRVN